jgi:predicted metal-dependent hydrolase
VITKEQFKTEITRWAAIMKVRPAQICVHEPKTFQDYVIVHELLHLQVPNHGKLFKSLMNAYLPGWEAILEAQNGGVTKFL